MLALPGFASAYTGCGGDTAPVIDAGYEQQVVELVNAQRLANGACRPTNGSMPWMQLPATTPPTWGRITTSTTKVTTGWGQPGPGV